MKREMLTKTTFTGTGRDAFSAAAVCAGASPAAGIFTPPPLKHSRFARPVALLAALFFAASLQAETYYWIGSTDGDWNNGANWSKSDPSQGDAEAVNEYPDSITEDDAYITQSASIKLLSNATVKTLYVNAALTLSSSTTPALANNRKSTSGYGLTFATIDGSSTLTLENGKLGGGGASTIESHIKTALSIASGTSAIDVPQGKNVYIDKVLEGSGTLLTTQANNYEGVKFGEEADATSFSGTFHSTDPTSGNNRNNIYFPSGKASSESAIWKFSGRDNYTAFASDQTYYFGALQSPQNNAASVIKIYRGYLDGKSNKGWVETKNATFEIGNLNLESAAVLSASASTACSVRKVGSGKLTVSGGGNNIKAVELKGGETIFSDVGMIPYETLSFLSDSSRSGVAAPSLTAGVEGLDPSAVIKNSDAAIAFDTNGHDIEWATALDSSNTGGLTKKGTGTLTLKAAPAYTGATTVEGGTLVFPDTVTSLSAITFAGGTVSFAAEDKVTIAAATVAADATLTLDGTEDWAATALTLETGAAIAFDATKYGNGYELSLEGVTAEASQISITTGEGFSGSFTLAEGTLTFKVAYDSANTNYIWQDATGDHLWATPGNWLVGGAASAQVPGEADSVIFPSSDDGWTVALGEDRTVASAEFSGKTTLSGAVLFSSAYAGSAKIVLADDAGVGNNGADLSFENPIEVAGADGHGNKLYSKGDGHFTAKGDISGAGSLELVVAGDQYGVTLAGANTMTSGSVIIKPALGSSNKGSGRRNCSHISKAASSANVAWSISNSDTSKSGGGWGFLSESDQTYCFGSVGDSTIVANGGEKNCVLEIGVLGRSDTLGGTLAHSSHWDYKNSIRKVGTGSLAVSASQVYAYDVNGGVLELARDSARPHAKGSIQFTGDGTLKLNEAFTVDVSTNIALVTSAYPIAVDDGGVERTWEVALPASTGGFTKKGSGTLTLKEVPAYTGMTTVEAGTLVTPVSDGKAYTVASKDATLKITGSADGATITIPANFFGADETTLGKTATAVYVESGEPTFVFEGESKHWAANALGTGWYEITNRPGGLIIIVR